MAPVTKFYVAALDALAKRTSKYITRWQGHLQANLTSDQFACITTLLNAANAVVQCLKAWTPPS